MKYIPVLVLVLALGCISAPAQKPDEVLATVNGQSIRTSDLQPATRQAIAAMPQAIAELRSDLIRRLMNDRALAAEAAATGKTRQDLIAAQKAKVNDPTDAQIASVIEANREALGQLTPAEARKRVITYLRGEPEQNVLNAYFTSLATKYKLALGKDVNSPGLQPTDAVAYVAGQPITAKEFEDFAAYPLWNARADLSDKVAADLRDILYQILVTAEAKARGIDTSDVIAQEVSNKLKDFTDEERYGLEDALAQRLGAKYQVKMLYKNPEPIVERVSAGASPARGPVTAPVTVVMFSDFQCPACSATHPILKQVMDEYPGKIRFVVRDFPLTSLHPDAWNAALAAAAANKQGKFFEYTDILYKNQSSLDDASLKKYAAELGLNARQFEIDFKSDAIAAEVKKDVADGESYHLTGTPSIFINGMRARRLDVAAFRSLIDRALGK
jgi:protein-disulfide isomerase